MSDFRPSTAEVNRWLAAHGRPSLDQHRATERERLKDVGHENPRKAAVEAARKYRAEAVEGMALEVNGDGRPEDAEPLASADLFEGRTCPSPQAVLWVGDHLSIEGVQPGAAPSKLAWSLYLWAKKHQGEFWQRVLPTAMPTRAQLTAGDPMRDDGADVLEAIEQCEKAARKAEAEALHGRHEIILAEIENDHELRRKVIESLPGEA